MELEQYSQEFETIIKEINLEIVKLPALHGKKRIAKYNTIKNKLSRANAIIRSMKLEIRGLKPEKRSKWQIIVTKYKTQLDEIAIEADIASKQNWNKEDEDEDFFDAKGVNSKKTTNEIIKKVLAIQKQDIGLLQDMIKDMQDITSL